MGAKSQRLTLSTLRKDVKDRDLAPIIGNLSQREKLYEIKPPLLWLK